MKVSVIIPAYNASKYIKEAINSCLIQKEVGEIIVVDDLSTDNTIDIVEGYTDKRVELIKCLSWGGPASAINIGIRNAKFELITVLGADDYFRENRFVENIKFLKQNIKLEGTYEVVQNFFEVNAKFGTEHNTNKIELKKNIKPKNLFNFVIRDKDPYFSVISVVYKNRFEKNVYNDIELRYGQDIDFIYELTRSYLLAKIEKSEPKIMRRLHCNNNTANSDFIAFDARKRILNKWYTKAVNLELSIIPSFYLIYRMACYKYLINGKKESRLIGFIIKFKYVINLIVQDFILTKRKSPQNY